MGFRVSGFGLRAWGSGLGVGVEEFKGFEALGKDLIRLLGLEEFKEAPQARNALLSATGFARRLVGLYTPNPNP